MGREKVVLIGSGNVAYSLASEFSQKLNEDFEFAGIVARNKKEGRALASEFGVEFSHEKLIKADIYIICILDSAVTEVSEKYDFGNAVVIHTSGTWSVDLLSDKINRRGVFYPLQTFTKGRKMDFSGIPVIVEATDPKTLATIHSLASKISHRVIECDSDKRVYIHISAVFACNFTNHMFSIAHKLMTSQGFDFDLLHPLIAESVVKAIESGNPSSVQTGPAVRGDINTIGSHMDILREDEQIQEIYKILSESIYSNKLKQ